MWIDGSGSGMKFIISTPHGKIGSIRDVEEVMDEPDISCSEGHVLIESTNRICCFECGVYWTKKEPIRVVDPKTNKVTDYATISADEA